MVLENQNSKTIEVEGRKFKILKFNALIGLHIAKLAMSKILPMLGSVPQALKTFGEAKDGGISNDALIELSSALDMLKDEELDKIIYTSLKQCYEMMPAGTAQVYKDDGTFGVQNVEYDPLLVLRLTCETVIWGCQGFFDGNRWSSIFGSIIGEFQLIQPT